MLMNCRVIAASRTVGAGADEIGQLAADKLSFRYVNNHIIDWAAERAGVSPSTIEKAEQTPPLIDRILQYLSAAGLDPGFGAYVPPPVQQSAGYESLIERVIRETAAEGDVVIVAHGASIPLAGSPGLLRVLLTASPKMRAARLAERAGMKESDAKKAVEASDRARRDFLQRFYDLKEELPTHYDLAINTDLIAKETAADLIVEAARRL
jgi:nucleotide-binding universal stress UspA family protein